MKLKIKRLLSLLAAASMTLSLSACTKASTAPATETASSTATQSSTTTGAVDSAATRTVSDMWGRSVEIPATVDSIVCLGSGAPRMAAYLEAVELMVGVEKHDADGMTVLRDYSPVYQKQLAALPVVGAGGGSGDNNGYPEALITLAPDVILAGFSQEAADELQGQTNIPVVSVRYLSNGFPDPTFYQAMEIFAQVVGKEDRCKEVLSFIDATKADLSSRTANLPEDKKQSVYTGAVTFNGKHGFAGTYSKFGPFDAIGAKNVADREDQPGAYETDFEQVIAWDPDVIFLDPGNMSLVNDEYKANPSYFQSIRAVQEGRVYTMPSFNNCSMNVTYALMNAYYAGIVLFPEQFSDVNIEGKSGEILTALLGADTYKAMAEGGLYYGEITIGE